MQVNATMILSICLSGCSKLALSALYSTSRLVSSNRAMPSSSGRSRCTMKRNHNWRLVMLLILLAGSIRQRLRHFAKQIIVQHLARDRRCRAAAVAAVLCQHDQRDPGLFGRRESDEPGMVAMAFLYLAFNIFFALLHADYLCRAGLSGNMIRRTCSGLHCRAARLGDRHHRAPDQIKMCWLDFKVEQRLLADCMVLLNVRAAHFPDQMRLVADAVIRQRCGGKSQLHRRHQIVALADPHRHGVARIPFLPVTLLLPLL